jgi:hypothetical protein
LLHKDRRDKMKNANAQNSTFANRTSRHTTKICKRAVFLPTHPSPPTTLDNSLTSIVDNRKLNDLKNVFLNFKN